MSRSRIHLRHSCGLIFRICLILCFAQIVRAQSTDATFPTPVGSKEIYAAIAARDVGDSRLTDHYYGIVGVPGDLVISVQAKNLNGDIDVFTAGDLKPLLKISVYAEITSPTTKNIYLRRRENLILRVEGRTPDDNDATYEIRFSGSFEPIPGGVNLATRDRTPAESDKAETSTRRGSRVSSVGARIEEPAVATSATPEPTPAATPAPGVDRPVTTTPARTATNRTTRGRRPVARKPVEKPATTGEKTADRKTGESNKTTEESSSANSEKVTKPEGEKSEPATKPSSSRSTPGRRTVTRAPKPTPPPFETEGKLIIVRTDGTQITYPMTDVRRVTVESGFIVIVHKDYSIERIPTSAVSRMSIGP